MLHRISPIVVLTGLILGAALLTSCDFASRHGSRVNETRSAAAADVKNIKIKTISDPVVIKTGPSSDIEVKLTGQTTAVEVLFYARVDGSGTLDIECREPWGLVFSDLTLTVYLPSGYKADSIDIDVVSGAVSAEEITTTGGTRVRVTSGSVKLNAMQGPCTVKTTSGSTEINYADKAYATTVDGVSGSIRVGIPAAGGNFSFNMESTSGSKECEFASGSSGTVGSGGPLVNLETTSGSIRIKKL